LKTITEIDHETIPKSLHGPLKLSLFLHVILISFLAFIDFPLPEPPPLIVKIAEESFTENEKKEEKNTLEEEKREDSQGHGSKELNEKSNQAIKKPTQGQIYVVKSGDSVGRIASQAGVTVEDMRKFNPCDLGDNPSLIIQPGDRLMIPGAGRKEPGPCSSKIEKIETKEEDQNSLEENEITEEELLESVLEIDEEAEEENQEAEEEIIDPCAADQPYDESCWPLDKERPKPLVTKLAGYENVGGWFKQPIKDNNGKLMGRAEFGTSSSPLNIPKNLTDGDGLEKGTSVVVEMSFSNDGKPLNEPKIILTSGYDSLDKRAIAWMKKTTFKDSFNRHQMENGGTLRIQFYFPGT